MSVNDSPTENSEQLTAKQEQMIALLAAGIHINAAAATVAVAEKTAHRWLKLPYVQEALRQARQELFNNTMEQLRDGVDEAIKVLKSVMTDPLTPAPSRVRAAQIWIEQAVMMYKDAELEAKLATLEQWVKGSGLLDEED